MSIDNSMMNAKTRMQKMGLLLAKYQRKALIIGGLFLMSLGFYLGFSFRSMGTTLYIMGVWWICSGLFLGLRDRYNVVSMGVGIVLMCGYRYPLLSESGLGIVLGAFNALFYSINKAGIAKKARRLAPPKPSFMAITLVGILALGMMSPLGSIHLTTAEEGKL